MYASSVVTSGTIIPGNEMISNQTPCFGNILSGCSIITINILLGLISRIAGVEIPEVHGKHEDFIPSLITTVRPGEAEATICEEVTSNLICHTVYPLDISEFCTPVVFDSWVHTIEECTKQKLKAHGCKIEKPSDVNWCEGLKENITQCVKETRDTPCHHMKVKIFNTGIPMHISVPKGFLPLIKGNKEHIRKAVQDCLNVLNEEAVNKCVPDLYDALLSIGMENPAYRPHSLRSERNSYCLKPLFTDCNLLSRESLQQHIAKEFDVFVNLTFGEGNVKWFSELSRKSRKVTVFGVQEPDGKEDEYQTKKSCSSKALSKWKGSLTECLSSAVTDLGLQDFQALTLKRTIHETNECIDKEGPLSCHLDTRSDYEDLLTYILDLIRHQTMVKQDYRSTIPFWKRALNLHGAKEHKKCHDSLKYDNIKHCAHNMYIYLTLLETSPNYVTPMARENEKNQECLSQSLKDCSNPIITGIMSVFMRAVGHQARKTRDVLGATPYRHKRLVSIYPMYGSVVTVCEEESSFMLPETTPMYIPEAASETITSHIPFYQRHHTTTTPSVKTRKHTRKFHTRIFIPQTHAPKTIGTSPIPTTQTDVLRILMETKYPPTAKKLSNEITEEEITETVTEPTSSPQCTEEEVEAWIEQTKGCSEMRIFQLYKARAEKCLSVESRGVFGNVSLCVNEMEPLMNQCGHERIYVFESIMEHLQKMIQQLKAEATQKCQSTSFCLSEKTQLVKCAGPFYDHLREMKETGKDYEGSLDLRSMTDIDQCLEAEMPKCEEKDRRTFREIVFITYGVEIPESLMEVRGNSKYCYMYTPQQISGTKTINFRTKPECGQDDVNKWLKAIRDCLHRRIKGLSQQSFKINRLPSEKVFIYIEMCIHVHRVLSCKPSNFEVFEPLVKQLLLNSKEDLTKLVETLKSQIPDVQDSVNCIQLLGDEAMQNCIPVLFEDMNYIYAHTSAKMADLESQRCVDNALPKCQDQTRKKIDYMLKSCMGILHESEKPEKEKSEPVNICRPLKAVDIGYRKCRTRDMHTELQYISHCLEKSIYSKPPNTLTVESAILDAEKCVQKYMLGSCYISDEKMLSTMVRYTFQEIMDNMRKLLTEKELQCFKLNAKSRISKCASLSLSYVNSLRKGQVVGAMSLANNIMKCMSQAMKDCPKAMGKKFTRILGTTSRVKFIPQSIPARRNEIVEEIRVNRDVYNDPEEYDSNIVFYNPTEESSETTTTLIETELDEEMEDSKVRRVREVTDDSDTTLETSRDDILTDETTKDNEEAEDYKVMPGQDKTDNVTKTNVLSLKECNETSFSGWINSYRECFISSKYKDDGRDLNNIIRRIVIKIEECLKNSVEKRCFPSLIQTEEFLTEVVFQAKDYAEMYLSEIRQGRGDIRDLQCIENLSLDWYINCTTNMFKYLHYLRNHLVSSDGFDDHVQKTALCLRYINEECSKTASTAFIDVIEVLLDLRSGTVGNQTVFFKFEESTPQKKSIGAKIVDFFKSVGEAIAKPFVWLYNAIKSFFHW